MKRVLLILIIQGVLVGSLMAQQSVFSVILNKGENTYGSGSAFAPVLLGSALTKDDELKVASDGYVALVHESTGSSLELKQSGQFTVSELEQRVSDQTSTVLDKYGKFLMDKLNLSSNGNQNLNVTGAVERGEEGLIKVYLPSAMDVFGNEAVVSWQQTDDIKDYVLTIKNMFDEVIDEQTVRGTSFTMDMEGANLKKESLMIVNVRAKGNDEVYSRDYGIKRLSDDAKASLNDEYSDIIQMGSSEDSLNKLLLATFFEENELLVDALTYYRKAMALSPDSLGFAKLYEGFLKRNGLMR